MTCLYSTPTAISRDTNLGHVVNTEPLARTVPGAISATNGATLTRAVSGADILTDEALPPRTPDAYWFCECTPRRQDLWIYPVRESSLGSAGFALIEVIAALYTISTLAWLILRLVS